jgi:predicted nucleic acid-binding protein
MNAKAFIDTNIFVYSFDQDDTRKAGISHDLIRELASNGTGIISFQVVQEFFSVALKRFPAAIQTEGAVKYLTSVLRPLLSVHSSIGLYTEALTIQSRYHLSWYDSLILAAATEAQCAILYSEDMQHGAKIDGVRIVNPFIP